MKLTEAQGIYLRAQIDKQQENRKNKVIETFPHLSETTKKALKLEGYCDEKK